MLGVQIDSGGEFVEKMEDLITGLDTVNGWSVAISLVSVVVLVGGRRLARGVPWALLVLVVGTMVVVLGDLADEGVKVLGAVESGAPSLVRPDLSWHQWLVLVPSAIALTLITTAEGLLVSRSYSEKRGYRTDPNQDLFAFGVGNVAAGVSGGFAVGSSTSRTASAGQAMAGARMHRGRSPVGAVSGSARSPSSTPTSPSPRHVDLTHGVERVRRAVVRVD